MLLAHRIPIEASFDHQANLSMAGVPRSIRRLIRIPLLPRNHGRTLASVEHWSQGSSKEITLPAFR